MVSEEECCDSAGRVAAAEQKARESYEAKIEAMNRAATLSGRVNDLQAEVVFLREALRAVSLATSLICEEWYRR